jgi:hypothetical protein
VGAGTTSSRGRRATARAVSAWWPVRVALGRLLAQPAHGVLGRS